MSVAEVNGRPAVIVPVRKPRPLLRRSTIIIALAAMMALLWLAQHVIDAGYLREDIEALQQGEAWRTGGWLTQVVLRIVGLLPETAWQQVTLSLVAAVVAGMMYGLLYDRLRASGWFVVGAIALVAAVALHVGALYTVTASSRDIPLLIAVGALIPAIRMLEDVGDVQSAIGLSLLLPLLLLASPLTTLLILPIAIGAALADPDGRRDPRAFVAMLLVAILPTIIVAIGIVGFLAQAHMEVADALLPYINTYANLRFGDVAGSLSGPWWLRAGHGGAAGLLPVAQPAGASAHPVGPRRRGAAGLPRDGARHRQHHDDPAHPVFGLPCRLRLLAGRRPPAIRAAAAGARATDPRHGAELVAERAMGRSGMEGGAVQRRPCRSRAARPAPRPLSYSPISASSYGVVW